MLPRQEYPRPQFVRESYENLNGIWEFEIDNSKSGLARGLAKNDVRLSSSILVPFCPESKLSGVCNKDFMYCVWYKRKLNIIKNGRRAILHFGAADYFTTVYINSVSVGSHKGGYASFSFDITDFTVDGENVLTVCCEDDTRSPLIPSGKQSDRYESYACDYTRTTGIWQTVWLEYVPETRIESVKFYPNIQNSSVTVCLSLRGKADLTLKASYGGNPCGAVKIPSAFGYVAAEIKLAKKHLWEIGQGNLYDLSLTFGDDEIKSYFALREVTFDDGFLSINGEKIFMRLVLDQGFYEEGVYTAPTDKDLENDILNSLKCGFNGARLHEKVFEERFLYYADKHGYIVWSEYPDWGLDHSDPVNIYSILPEWTEEINRDFNHPAIIGWCPHNETWDQRGKKQYDPAIKLLYDMTKALDPTRPCIDTSGNYHVVTDLYDLHDYSSDPAELASHYADLNNMSHHSAFKNRQTYRGGAVFISEYGGIGWNVGDGWGYGNGPKTEEELYSRLDALTSALVDNPNVSGFCYTQLTDVEQERNGLFTFSRAPKFDLPRLKKIFSKERKTQ